MLQLYYRRRIKGRGAGNGRRSHHRKPLDYTPGGLGTWVPSTVSGLKLWFDASNSGSITQVAGAISQWNDLSGQNLHVTQSTAAKKPTYLATTQNGRNTVSWDGGDELSKQSGVSGLVPRQTQTTFCAVKSTVVGAGAQVYWTTNGATIAGVIQHGIDKMRYQGNTNNYAENDPSGGGTTAAWHAYSGYILAAKRELFMDGTQVAINNTAETLAVAPTQIWLGSDSVSHFTGEIAEFFQYDATLSTLDRQKGEGYLAWKWGTQSLLPGGHPYANGGPNA